MELAPNPHYGGGS